MSSAAPRAARALPGAGAWKLLSELALSAIAATGLATWALPSSAECLYWSDDAGIWRANLDGSDAQLLVETTRATAVAVDPDAGKLYWSDWLALKRSDLDGANVEIVEPVGQFDRIADLAIDLDARKIYLAWRSDCPGCGGFFRMDLDAGSWEVLSWSLRWELSVAIDPANDRSCACCGIQYLELFCSNLDGSAPPVVITSDSVRGVALDGAGSVYWIEPGRIRRARLDGSGAEDLVTGIADGRALALAPASGEMYWVAGSGLGNGTLERAFLDGSGAAVLRTGLEGPQRIALLPEPSRWLLLAAGLGSLLLLHRVSRPDNRPFGCAPSAPGAAG